MDQSGARRVVQDADSFADVERSLRVQQIMQLSQERRDGLMIDLVYELRSDLIELRGEVNDIKNDRDEERSGTTLPPGVHAIGHMLTLAAASVVGLFGQSWMNR